MKRLFLASVFFACICLVLAFIWFHTGLLVAFGESEIPFFNPGYVVHFYGSPWSPTSLGFFPGTTLSLTPFFVIADWIWKIPLPPVVVEGFFFFSFAFLGMVGGYVLVSSLFEGDKQQKFIFSCIGGLFYTLNFISLVLAFNRLQYPFTIFYLGVPFGLVFFMLGILKRQLRYIVYFNLAVLFFVGGFGGLPFMEIVWYFLGTFFIFNLITSRLDKKRSMFSLKFFVLCFLLWIIINLWWLTSSMLFAFFLPHPAYSIKGNIGTFDILSEWQGNLSYLFRLMNQHYLQSMVPTWGTIFFSPVFIIISYIIAFLAFLPLLFRKKPSILYYFLGLALLVLFFTKGSSGPFGEIFEFFFSHIFILEVFRNSFEKIGILLPATYVPLVSYSLWTIFQFLYKKRKKTAYGVIGLITFLLCWVLVFPFWNGWVFTYNQPPANNPKIGEHVQVPDYYIDANKYINKDTSDNRILALPMSSEGITTNWPHPYNGVEYTNGLFEKSAISYSTIMPYLENITAQMNYTFVREPTSIAKIMQLLDAKYLLLRSDIDYKARLMPNPQVFTAIAHKGVLSGLTFKKNFGQLQFYETNAEPTKLYVANRAVIAPAKVLYTDIFTQASFSAGDIIITRNDNIPTDTFAKTHPETEFIQPTSTIDYSKYPKISLTDAEAVIPSYYRFLPNSHFFFLEILKEKAGRIFTLDSEDRMFYDIETLSHRFGELQTVALARNSRGVSASIASTQRMIDSINQAAIHDYGSNIQTNINNFRLRMLLNEIVLDNLLTSISDPDIHNNLLQLKKSFDNFEVQLSVKSKYDKNYSTEDKKRIVYQFNLNNAGKYSFVIKDESFSSFYEVTPGAWDVYINNILFHIQPKNQKGWFDFGELDLQKGLNEIHIFIPVAKNLIQTDTTKSIVLIGNKNISKQKVSFPVMPFDAFSSYTVFYTYRLNTSGGPKIEAENEFNAPHAEDNTIYPQWERDLEGTQTGNIIKWVNSSDIIYPPTTANVQNITFTAEPVNNCQHENQYNTFNIDKCKNDPSFARQFLTPTKLEVKDVRVERTFSNTALLISKKTSPPITSNKPTISYKRLDSSKYLVSIKNATQPFVLVFSETYYADWKAMYADTHEEIPSSNHILVNDFANAWYIKRNGNYDITLEFVDARLFTIGKAISIPVIIVCVGFVIFLYVKKRK